MGRTDVLRVVHPWYLAGAAVSCANMARRRITGYKNPRPFRSNNFERAYQYDLEIVDRWLRFARFDGQDILELGPGPDLGTGAEMLARGARSYLGLDAFPLARDVDRDFYLRFRPEGVGEIEYEVLPFSEILNLNRRFSLVVSNACLEHVGNVAKLFADLRELMTNDGRMVHLVDAQTHSRPLRTHDPLNIYRFSNQTYSRIAAYPGAPNRLLPKDYVTSAQEAGFRSVDVVARRTLDDEVVRRIRDWLAPRFRSSPNLNMMSFFLVAAK